jgi:predicted nuclease of predicted toxin-antitoxin system
VKLLFDENLSFRLVRLLADVYPGSAHVRGLGLLGAEDAAIWAYAAEHGFTLVSKDADFYDRSALYGSPPKVIWLRIGNRGVAETAGLIRSKYILIRHFHEDERSALLPLHAPSAGD